MDCIIGNGEIKKHEKRVKSTLIQLMTYINETFHFRATLFFFASLASRRFRLTMAQKSSAETTLLMVLVRKNVCEDVSIVCYF